MTPFERSTRSGLDKATIVLLWLAFALALLHHTDHVLRVDHSGWPFRSDVNPFTFSLLAYPMIAFALFGPRRLLWARWAILMLGAAATLAAHVAVETPRMQYVMWAANCSADPHAGDVHNLLNVRSPAFGLLSVAVAMTLNVVAVTATVSMLAQVLRSRKASRPA